MDNGLTIAIPVYERVYRFEEALKSAMGVKGCSEILVVDDNSSHSEFEKICNSIGDERIKYKRNNTNLGIFGNWNNCAALSTQNFIAILCSDDLVEPDMYVRFTAAINAFPDIDVYFGPFAIFSDSVENAVIKRTYPPGPISAKVLLEDAIVHGASFPVLSIIRRSKLLQFPFVAKPHSGNDWLWIYSNAHKFKLFADSKPLNFWRQHAKQDAKVSQSITTDCWPMMYSNMADQLESYKSKKVRHAKRRSVGVILSWLLNDKAKDGYYANRLLGTEGTTNPFLHHAKEIVNRNWLLQNMLTSGSWPLYYNLGRVVRKMGIYPHPYTN